MIEMNKDIEMNYQDVDYAGNLKISKLFDVFSNIATAHASIIGVWNESLKNDYGWVVSKMRLEILEPIQPGNYVLNTFTGMPSKVIFPRYYHLMQNNRSVVKASSVWTLLDLKRRRIVLPKRVGIDFPQDQDDVSSFCAFASEIPNDINYELIENRKVKFSDVDTNQHMNNARYIEWACDILPYECFKTSYISELDIYFKHEIAPLSDVALYLYQENDEFFVKGEVEGIVCFEMKGLLKNIK